MDKKTKKTNRFIAVSIIIALVIVVLIANNIMSDSVADLDEKYVLYTLVQDETTSEAMNKRVKFDASHLLKQPRYIKASDAKIIDLEYTPIDETDRMFWFEIRDNIPELSKFLPLKKMVTTEFSHVMKDKVSWEYLYSGFTRGNTKILDKDYFRIYYYLDGKTYQKLLMRIKQEEGNKYYYMMFDKVSENPDALTYKQYLAQQKQDSSNPTEKEYYS